MDEEELLRELNKRKLRNVLVGLAVLAAVVIGGYFFIEWMLASMGLQPAPADFEAQAGATETGDTFAQGHVAIWTGEETDDALQLPAYEVTVEDYRMEGLSRVGRPSATQEKLSTELFVVINDDPGDTVLGAMSARGILPKRASTCSILIRDNPTNWKTLSVFDPVTVTITVPDALQEDAFTDHLVAYAVYSKQYPDDPGGLATLPVSVSEEDGICYASFLIREEYETEYALCATDG
ncbi:MAG: hypothetical protein K5696_00465 [Lachnospiraceae bacterium]|nr:hypothetical protein [Lachnospiraceae bacterium]